MIEIQDLHVNYGRVRALSSVSLSVRPKTIFAVLGANGAGKTTLLRSILGLASSKGSIRLDGADITQKPVAERVRQGIALVPEGRKLFADFTVGENLRIGAFNRKDAAGVKNDIDEICATFPILGKRYHQQSRTLSGGEGQMLAIGRALLSRPKLLLLDEPSVGLMPIFVSEIFKLIASIVRTKDLTVLVVEQNTKKALGIADDAAVLELGRIAFFGSADRIASDPRVKEAYLGG